MSGFFVGLNNYLDQKIERDTRKEMAADDRAFQWKQARASDTAAMDRLNRQLAANAELADRDREHDLTVLDKTQEFTLSRDQLNHLNALALQGNDHAQQQLIQSIAIQSGKEEAEVERAWRSSEAALGRGHDVALQASDQEHALGMANLSFGNQQELQRNQFQQEFDILSERNKFALTLEETTHLRNLEILGKTQDFQDEQNRLAEKYGLTRDELNNNFSSAQNAMNRALELTMQSRGFNQQERMSYLNQDLQFGVMDRQNEYNVAAREDSQAHEIQMSLTDWSRQVGLLVADIAKRAGAAVDSEVLANENWVIGKVGDVEGSEEFLLTVAKNPHIAAEIKSIVTDYEEKTNNNLSGEEFMQVFTIIQSEIEEGNESTIKSFRSGADLATALINTETEEERLGIAQEAIAAANSQGKPSSAAAITDYTKLYEAEPEKARMQNELFDEEVLYYAEQMIADLKAEGDQTGAAAVQNLVDNYGAEDGRVETRELQKMFAGLAKDSLSNKDSQFLVGLEDNLYISNALRLYDTAQDEAVSGDKPAEASQPALGGDTGTSLGEDTTEADLEFKKRQVMADNGLHRKVLKAPVYELDSGDKRPSDAHWTLDVDGRLSFVDKDGSKKSFEGSPFGDYTAGQNYQDFIERYEYLKQEGLSEDYIELPIIDIHVAKEKGYKPPLWLRKNGKLILWKVDNG